MIQGYSPLTVSLYVEVTETSVSQSNNTSNVTIQVYANAQNSPTTWVYGNLTVSLNGQIITTKKSVTFNADSTTLIFEQSNIVVPHEENGSKTVKWTASLSPAFASDYSTVFKAGSTVLTNISRLSSLVFANDGKDTLGNVLTIYISSFSENFTHNIYYNINGHTGTIVLNWSSDTYYWRLPLNFAGYIDSTETEANLQFACETLLNGSSLGVTYANKTVVIPEDDNTIPSLDSLTTVDIGDNPFSVYTQDITRLEVTPVATGKYGASIVSCTTIIDNGIYENVVENGVISSITTTNLHNSGSIPRTIIITDSRGFEKTVTDYITIYEYHKPVLNSLKIVQNNGSINIKVSGNVSSVNNENEITLFYRCYPDINSEETYEEETIYNHTDDYSFNNVSSSLSITGLLKGQPAKIDVYIQDKKYNEVVTKVTNMDLSLSKYDNSFIAVNADGNLYTVFNSADYWTNEDVVVGAEIKDIIWDKQLNRCIGYDTLDNFYCSTGYIITSWEVFPSSFTDMNVLGKCTAFNKAFYLVDDKICYFSSPTANVIVFTTVDTPNLVGDDLWEYIVGNESFLFIISTNGKIAYWDGADWNFTIMLSNNENIDGKLLSDYMPINSAQFVATTNGLIGIINDEFLVRTPVVPLR